eukprot:SAG31_NODE_863_length_11394_cov_8.226737_9_plen_263_part_00
MGKKREKKTTKTGKEKRESRSEKQTRRSSLEASAAAAELLLARTPIPALTKQGTSSRLVTAQTGPATRSWKESGKNFKKGSFTTAELKLLTEAATEYVKAKSAADELAADMDACIRKLLFANKRGGDSAWLEIATCLPHRTVQACFYAAKRRLYPAKKGKWEVEEAATLRDMVEKLGTKEDSEGSSSGTTSITYSKIPWKVIGEELNRLPEACRDKWREIAAGDKLQKGFWTTVRICWPETWRSSVCQSLLNSVCGRRTAPV